MDNYYEIFWGICFLCFFLSLAILITDEQSIKKSYKTFIYLLGFTGSLKFFYAGFMAFTHDVIFNSFMALIFSVYTFILLDQKRRIQRKLDIAENDLLQAGIFREEDY